MKRNTLTAWLLGIILIFSATSCFNGPIVKGSKNYITKKENLEHFNDISMSGSANIIYQQDSSSRIEIYGSDNIVELLETKVNGKTLNIKFKKECQYHRQGQTRDQSFLTGPERTDTQRIGWHSLCEWHSHRGRS